MAFLVARRVLPVTAVTHTQASPSNPEGLAEHPASCTLVSAFDLGPGRGSCKFSLKRCWEYLGVLSCVEGGGGQG